MHSEEQRREEVDRVRRAGGRDLDREHEHGPGRQQEAVPDVGRDYQADKLDKRPLRSLGFGNEYNQYNIIGCGFACNSFSVRDGLLRAEAARMEPPGPIVPEPAAEDDYDARGHRLENIAVPNRSLLCVGVEVREVPSLRLRDDADEDIAEPAAGVFAAIY